MYFKTIRAILDEAIPKYAKSRGISTDDVDKEIAAHIESTAHEHNGNPDPNIDYKNYLCRLGYLFVHVGVNSTLVERSFTEIDSLRQLVKSKSDDEVSICTIGGGPGTELLGFVGFLRSRPYAPARVNFTVLDRVQTWSETWRVLARASEELLKEKDLNVTLSREFQAMDVTEPSAFESYGELFGEQDIFIFNYILSENQVRLNGFKETLGRLIQLAKPGAMFVFVDRIEYVSKSTFVRDVEAMINSSGLVNIEREDWSGCIDDPESDLEPYRTRFDRRPRRWYRTYHHHNPTAFTIVATKPAEP